MTTKRAKAAPKAKKAKIEPMTVSQFKSKLEGIEMFQEDNWSPSPDQWALIREMINNIKETEKVEVVNEQPQQFNHYAAYGMPPQQMPRQAMPMNPGVSSLSSMIEEPAESNLVVPTMPVTSDVVTSGQPTVKSARLLPKTGSDGKMKSSFE